MVRKALTGLLFFCLFKVIVIIHAGEHGWLLYLIAFMVTLLPCSLAWSYHQDAKWRAEGRTNFFDTTDAIKLVFFGFLFAWLFGDFFDNKDKK